MTSKSSVASIQQPLHSGFTASSTADDVIAGIDLHAKNVIVTGGDSGIGLDMVRVLAKAGAHVFVPSRDPTYSISALKDLEGDIEIEFIDLADPKSIDIFVQNFLAKKIPLHILFNNAGLLSRTLVLDSRGIERHFAVNHLGHFQLTLGLLPALRAAKGARVVSTSAAAHRATPVRFDDIHFKTTPYDFWLGYAQSKTANILFAFELDKREKQNGVRAFSTHPGIIATNISSDKDFLKSLGILDANGTPVINPKDGFKSTAQGASTQVFAGVSPLLDEIGGVYLEDNDVAAFGSGVCEYAIDDKQSKRLWKLSEELITSSN